MLFFPLAMVAAQVSSASPLVTAEGALNLVTSSLTLLKDAGLFAHNKAVSLLPEEPREGYESLLAKVAVQINPAIGTAFAVASPYLIQVQELVMRLWSLVEKRTLPFINSLVLDFERRYPSHAGKIGTTLADKITLFFVLWLLTGVFVRASRRVLCGRRKAAASKSVIYPTSTAKGDVRASFPGKKND